MPGTLKYQIYTVEELVGKIQEKLNRMSQEEREKPPHLPHFSIYQTRGGIIMNLKGRHFLTLKDYTPEEIAYLLELSADLKKKRKREFW